MKPYFKKTKYYEDKFLGLNLCYENNCRHHYTKDGVIPVVYKEFYIDLNLFWWNVIIGFETKEKEIKD